MFASCGIYFYNDLNLTGIGTAQHVDVVNASASLFNVLGVKPQLGRTFTAAEDQKRRRGTAILSDSLWHGAFGSDPQVLGRVIHLNGMAYKVIGVMPRSFQFPSRETQLWIPIALRSSEFTIEGGRSEKWLHMVARLRPMQPTPKSQRAARGTHGSSVIPFPCLLSKERRLAFHALGRLPMNKQNESAAGSISHSAPYSQFCSSPPSTSAACSSSARPHVNPRWT